MEVAKRFAYLVQVCNKCMQGPGVSADAIFLSFFLHRQGNCNFNLSPVLLFTRSYFAYRTASPVNKYRSARKYTRAPRHSPLMQCPLPSQIARGGDEGEGWQVLTSTLSRARARKSSR